ncbi:hypothetical protein AAMO2058_000484000 [Amorphochlora amoebiformis]
MSSANLSVRQIKEILDAAGVDYSDCTEKKDLIKRLEKTRSKARPRAQTDSNPDPPPRRSSPSEPSRPAGPRSGGGGGGRSSGGSSEHDLKDISGLIRRINSFEDYYDILGVSKDSTENELKKAYRKLALKLHPDKCSEQGSEDAFKKVGAAYHCLSDPDKRRRYDLMGPAAANGGGAGFGGEHPDVDEIFRQFFGGNPNGPGGGGVRFHFGGPGGMFFQNFGPDMRRRQRAGGGEAINPGLGQLLPFLPIIVMMVIHLAPALPYLISKLMVFPVVMLLPQHLRIPALILISFMMFT